MRRGESQQPINNNNNNNDYGTRSDNTDDILSRDSEDSLLSFSRIKRSFNLNQSNVYIISSAIVGFFVCCSVAVILFFGINRILHPNPLPNRYIEPLTGFDKLPSRGSLRSHLKYITKKTHIAGKGKELADWYAKRLKSFGLEAEIITYYPYLNYPSFRKLAIVEPAELKFEAKLEEAVINEDNTSKDNNLIPTFHGYSASGNVTGELIYANYGTYEDFQILLKNNINIKNKIVLVKYGKCFRGLKVRAAELFGAKGVLIYSDPKDDGFIKGQVYPDGPLRPSTGVQRGSVSYLSLGSGDPLTPGKPATEHAERIPIEESKFLAKIPSLPISYEDAYPLLKALSGEGKRASKLGPNWEGGLNISYWTGPSEAKVNLVNLVHGGIHKIYDVIATIPGVEEPEHQIILGNHRDAWVFGAVDPGAGSSALLEVARTLGILLKRGWKPRRTIKLASWDAEEYGLVGSTEYVEDYSKKLTKEALAYINVDNFEGDLFLPSGTPSLFNILKNVSQTISHPSKNGTIYDHWLKDTKLNLSGLGSGSDFTPFYQHLGISSLHLTFNKRGGSGVYHSNYDSFHYMEKFGDPEFRTHLAMTQLLGKLLIHLSDDTLLPFQLNNYGKDLKKYLKTYDELDEFKFLKLKDKLNYLPLKRSINEFYQINLKVDEQVKLLNDKLKKRNHRLECPIKDENCEARLKVLNSKLAFLERYFLDEKGIQGREFYKHIIFAPGLWAGYETQVFPALREALDNKDIKKANQIILDYSTQLDQATQFLKEEL